MFKYEFNNFNAKYNNYLYFKSSITAIYYDKKGLFTYNMNLKGV